MSNEEIKKEDVVVETPVEVKKEETPVVETPIEYKKEEKLVDFTKKILKPHNKVSREVTEQDIETVKADGRIMYNLCYTQCGIYPGAYAVAHAQINDTDPLRFFITGEREIIVNPVITRHTKTTVDSKEGCITFGDKEQKIVQRWHKIEVDCQSFTNEGKLTEKMHLCLSGKDAFIFQHEIDHMDAKYIY